MQIVLFFSLSLFLYNCPHTTEENRNGQNRQSQDSSNVEDSQSQDPAVEGLSEATKGNKPPPNVILSLLIISTVYFTHLCTRMVNNQDCVGDLIICVCIF